MYNKNLIKALTVILVIAALIFGIWGIISTF
jgi:hypothetical protein